MIEPHTQAQLDSLMRDELDAFDEGITPSLFMGLSTLGFFGAVVYEITKRWSVIADALTTPMQSYPPTGSDSIDALNAFGAFLDPCAKAGNEMLSIAVVHWQGELICGAAGLGAGIFLRLAAGRAIKMDVRHQSQGHSPN